MKIGTKVNVELIADDRFLGSCRDLETKLSAYISSLSTAIYGEGVELYEVGDTRKLDFKGDEPGSQLRKSFTLVLTKNLTKNKVYEIINQVRPQPLKFY